MFAQVSERKMLGVRILLFLGWVFLIATLFYDPFSVSWTDPSSSSPFALGDKKVYVQGEVLPEQPYSMSARIYWAMVIPIVPIFLMLFGHEAWRRICPLSFASQLPRYLGFLRMSRIFNRRTGQVDRTARLLSHDSWLARNHWYVQGGFLASGICARLLFINSDRTAMAAFLIFIIVAAFVTGILYGGKTWCNYLCPIAPVQKIYTEPRGLLESQARPEKQAFPQSTCRTTKAPEKSACVGCQINCPDQDLEKSYWESLYKPGRRLFYYGYLGLVFSFYFYYFVYSCNWDYYYSGAWTHEETQLSQLMDPGVCYNDQAITPIPKIAAAPLTLLFFIALTYSLGRIIEGFYGWLRKKMHRELPKEEVRHQIFSVFAFVTFNVFYVFGGRPNLGLLPDSAQYAVNGFIFLVSSMWFYRTINRHYSNYKRESLLGSVLRQLKKLKIDYNRLLGGRNLDDLNADEAYIMAKVLPEYSGSQKFGIYRDIVIDALNNKGLSKQGAIAALKDIQNQLGVSEEEHNELVGELGLEDAFQEDSEIGSAHNLTLDDFDRLNNYQTALEFILKKYMTEGSAINHILKKNDARVEVDQLRNYYSITDSEHEQVVQVLIGDQKIQISEAQGVFDDIANIEKDLVILNEITGGAGTTVKLIEQFLKNRQKNHIALMLKILARLGDTAEAVIIAGSLAALLGERLKELVESPSRAGDRHWVDNVSPRVHQALTGRYNERKCKGLYDKRENDSVEFISREQVIGAKKDSLELCHRLINDKDAVLRAAALRVYAQVAPESARKEAEEILNRKERDHWLVEEIARKVKKGERVDTRHRTEIILTRMSVSFPNSRPVVKKFYKPKITVGLAPGNDVVINHHHVAAEHLRFTVSPSGVLMENLGPAKTDVFIGDRKADGIHNKIVRGDNVQIGSFNSGPIIGVDWTSLAEMDSDDSFTYRLLPTDTFQMMLHLFESDFFNYLKPEVLVEIAQQSELCEYDEGRYIFREGDPSDNIYLLISGRADVIVDRNGKRKVIDSIPPGQTVGELGVFTNKERSANIVTTEKNTRVIVIDGQYFLEAAGLNTSVASSFLKVISTRQQHILTRV